uniref:Uncharacterized protein n=1 Tax=Echeneis naucrates TaxID=173247 RepID=A0A665TMJ1_ECHNA
IKGQSAADRLVRLPLVRSAFRRLSVWYTDAKHIHPGLRTMCEVVENSVAAACDRASPVVVKLGPQISTANNVACQSLDWLESKFPVLHTPTEQVKFDFLSLLNPNKIHKMPKKCMYLFTVLNM